MSENNAGVWEPVRPASNPPADTTVGSTPHNAARQAPYVQPQGPNPFAQPGHQAPAATPARPQTQPPAAAPTQAPPPTLAPGSPQPAPAPTFTAPAQQQPSHTQQPAPAAYTSAPEQHPASRPQTVRPEQQQYAVSARDLSTSLLLKQVKPAPTTGWRRMLYQVSGRYINLGNSAKEQRRIELTKQVNQPLQGCYKIALLSLKGGVGKTTTTATLGSTFASLRGDRVIAVDANPDRGTLSQKIPLETPATVRNLLRDEHSIEKYSDVRSYTSQSRHRLEVLASDSDPAVSEAFSADDYARTVAMLEKFYSIVLTDCGTGLMHSAMQTILEEADALVVVSSGSVDGARSASATLDWLDAHGYRELVAKSVAVVNAVRPRSGKVDLPKVVEHFEQRCRLVRLIPFDPHLEEGAEIELDRLRPKTRNALLELAAAVASDFPASTFALQDHR
ncbi:MULTISPECIES: MinD/ParA family protein [Rhodococcus]|uniref:AAA family ATPase n=1 Tax=Rhodococcus oxybenzonivorans TaxID=1990687 RepID=A0AAE5A9T4_9NOCA|nr:MULTISPECIES: AAA family ATPase [Rhodococcus]MDV7240446.1 AAA family ATPase [Rhodococcus oxybenzonivorans]MDV7268179.1 AAA family ATPase [Rhodococcus oxybenzonivorans]MDV7272720.1 AAA family ATPase [Rhodococcus oxybenzonivorans]MDV7333542.1 AAA family ATPase [Rhodococcus oxybenzonivorans]MDV7342709.1 AAA family ATPase [Rhodococcus oxybenzonivorans]